MKVLALDTATVVATVAIADEEKLYSETTIHSKKKKSFRKAYASNPGGAKKFRFRTS